MLTRKQLQNDLDAERKHAINAEAERDAAYARARSAEQALQAVLQERDDWRAAFKTISKLVK